MSPGLLEFGVIMAKSSIYTACKSCREMYNAYRPEPAIQSIGQLWPLPRSHSKPHLTMYDWSGPRSYTHDNKPAACKLAARRYCDII